jgi:hypothetical protein
MEVIKFAEAQKKITEGVKLQLAHAKMQTK